MRAQCKDSPYTRKKKWHTACLLVKLNIHPDRQFPAHFVVHMPSCLHVLFRVARPLQSKRGGEGTVIWGMFPRGCEDTVARRWLLYKGVGGTLSALKVRTRPPSKCEAHISLRNKPITHHPAFLWNCHSSLQPRLQGSFLPLRAFFTPGLQGTTLSKVE